MYNAPVMAREDKYTCIFGGGAVRGFAYIGAIKAMQELRLKYDTVAGSSAGAIVATLLAVGYSYDEIKEVLMKINFDLFRDIHFGLNSGFALSKGEVFTKWMRKNIEKKVYGENYVKGKNKPVTFADLDTDLLVYTTNLVKFDCQEFSKQETPDFEIAEAVRISCSMPGLMTLTEVNGKKLVDGDLLKSKPLWKLSKNLKVGINRILEFRLEGEYEKVDNNALDFFNAIYSCMTSAATDYIIDTYGYRDDFDYIKINTGDVIIIDFNMSDYMRNKLIDIGYNQSKKYLTQDIVTKKQKLLTQYQQIYKYIIQLLDFIKSNNIEKSKMLVGDLYILLADIKDSIAIRVYKSITEFKDEFLISSKGRSWFGTPRFKDKKSLLKTLTRLVFEVNSRINSLNLDLQKIECLK